MDIDIIALFGALWRGKWFLVLCLVVGVFAGGYYGYKIAVPQYRATATISFLSTRAQNVSGVDSVVSGLRGDLVTMNTEIAVMQSRQLVGKLVDALDLSQYPEFNPWLRELNPYTVRNFPKYLMGKLEKPQMPADEIVRRTATAIAIGKISVVNSRGTLVLRISATTENGPLSAAIANKLAELYILDQIETKFAATEQATAWLSGRVAELKTELEEIEANVKDFDAQTDLVSPEALAALRFQFKDNRDRLDETRVERERLAARVTELETAQSSGDFERLAELANDRTLDRVLSTVDLESATGQEAFFARYRQVIIRSKLGVNRADEQIVALERSLEDLEAAIDKQSVDLVALQQLKREAEATKTIYEFFFGRLKETSAREGLHQADSRILSEAVPGGYFAPRKNRIMFITGIIGLLLGAGLLILRELLQNSFRTSEELEEATGYTVMGSIPRVPAKSRRDVLSYVLNKPNSALAESVRNLRTSIMLSNVDDPPQIVMLTSSVPGEGKTTQSLILAQNMSALGKRVLLIEGDVRRRKFADYLDTNKSGSIVSVLAGGTELAEAVQPIAEIGADVLAGEKSKVNAADLFASKSFENLLADARSRYDSIIIDTPPVLIVPDARVIGQFADAILYSVHWDKTPRSQVVQGLRMFESVGLKVTGLSLTQVDPKGLKRYGYGRYGAYGYYKSGYYDN